MDTLNVLLIVNTAAERAGTIREHVAALNRLSRHRVFKVDNALAHRVELAAFDVIVLHYSLVIASPVYISDVLREKIARFRGLKVLFIQDEYRWINATARAMHELGIRVVFSLVEPHLVRQVYHHPFLADVRFEFTLTGYVSPALVRRRVPPYQRRPIDIGYRARKLSPWYGSCALQKWQIADAVVVGARPFGLNLDISTREEDRIYGSRWTDFIANCKATLGTEGGAGVLDYDDEIRPKVEAYAIEHPEAGFDELRRRFFADNDGRVVMLMITPRCFEAAALRTLMVMYPGDYTGILDPGRHYVVLQPDHSNIGEVVDIIRSPARALPVIERAYREIACNDKFSYAALGRHFDRVLEEEGRISRAAPWTPRVVWQARLTGEIVGLSLRTRGSALLSKARHYGIQTAVRLERCLLAAARTGLSDKGFARFESRMRKLRHTARRFLVGA